MDIWNLVKWGIDTFDCVSPTRLARHGAALMKTKSGKVNIKNSTYKDDLLPIDTVSYTHLTLPTILLV